jgi:hypothetical protein
MKTFRERIKQDWEDLKSSFVKAFGCLVNLFIVAAFLGGLWLAIALVKWMWEHS